VRPNATLRKPAAEPGARAAYANVGFLVSVLAIRSPDGIARVDLEHRVIPGIRQLREERVRHATGDFAVPGDDGSPLADWDLDGVEYLAPPLRLKFALSVRCRQAQSRWPSAWTA